MNFVQILDEIGCADIGPILGLVKTVVNVICWAIPIIIIVLSVIDIAKLATAGNLDDKLKKEVTQRVISRIIYAIVIFLVPTIVGLIFRLVSSTTGSTAAGCWSEVVAVSKVMPINK